MKLGNLSLLITYNYKESNALRIRIASEMKNYSFIRFRGAVHTATTVLQRLKCM